MTNFVLRIAFSITILIGASIPLHSYAQFSDADTISLSTTNSTIQPNSETIVSLDAYTIDMVGAVIRWFIDDTEITEARGNRSVVVKTGPVGTKTVVRASIAREGRTTISTSRTLIPSRINIVIEADTYTPIFYEGRALPVTGGTIRAIAIPIVGGGGDPASFSYDWRRNGNSVLGGPSLGKQSIEIETSRYGRESITVTVYNTAGENLGTASISHQATEPELYFYENNPLDGLRGRAIIDAFTMVGDEVTIQAEPFFIESGSTAYPNTYEWRVDGQVANNETGTPNQITLGRATDVGSAIIDLKLVSGTGLPHLLRDSFSIFYQ